MDEASVSFTIDLVFYGLFSVLFPSPPHAQMKSNHLHDLVSAFETEALHLLLEGDHWTVLQTLCSHAQENSTTARLAVEAMSIPLPDDELIALLRALFQKVASPPPPEP